MEIINLLLFALLYYIFYYLEFYIKVLLFIGGCISLSYFNKYLSLPEEELEENYYYQIYLNCIENFTYCYNKLIIIGEELNKIYFFNKMYEYVKYLDNHYVKGKQILLIKFGEKMFLLPPMPMPKQIFPKNVLNNNNNFKSLSNKSNLEKEEEILDFLDSLSNKKED